MAKAKTTDTDLPPAAPAEAAPRPRPKTGGSFMRNADGSLSQVEEPTAPAPVKETSK
ncbi:hypothetical protein sos41_31290 [Alphaproteobacteria bacterium SO-S41]|nr:hypothetical protein sos41_31290 [Alphaproteobacteria bacterium SO-S41]